MKFLKICFILYLPMIFGYVERQSKNEKSKLKTASMEFDDFLPVINEFSTYSTINPEIVHKKAQRFSRSTPEVEHEESHPMTLKFQLDGQTIYIDLKHKNDFLPEEHFVRIQDSSQPTGYLSKNFNKTEMKPCHYEGSIRHKPASKVLLSTCSDNINGVLFYKDETYFIHAGNASSLNDKHFFFRQRDLLKTNATCSHQPSEESHIHEKKFHWKPRLKRDINADPELFQDAYKSNEKTSYLELAIVVDNAMFNFYEQNIQKIHYLCLDLTHIINSIYAPLNIFVVLVDVIIWTSYDKIAIRRDASATLKNFLDYRKNELLIHYPNDHAQLLTARPFEKNVVGKANLEAICSTKFSGAVCVDHSRVTGIVASTMAHEMGHNFGLQHDEDVRGCECPVEKCVMSQSITSFIALEWSYCSLEGLHKAIGDKMNYCMRNKPRRVFGAPICGNNIVEHGEQCDCGTPGECSNSCCNPKTCQLRPGAKCAAGKCCNLETCNMKRPGSICRGARSECDLPEYCTGKTASCPLDTFKQELEPCDNNSAFCYQGQCQSHRLGCQFLWGDEASSDSPECYLKTHNENTARGLCNFDSLNRVYTPCEEGHELCGMLQCQTTAEDPIIGSPFIRSIGGFFTWKNRSHVRCRWTSVDLGLDNNPSFVGNGAKCGENKMCLGRKCVALESLRVQGVGESCSSNCSGNGVCNSRGNCHCDIGFGGERCHLPGAGGSVDSGPATNPKPEDIFKRFVWIFGALILCAILCILALSVFNYCKSRKSNKSINTNLITSQQSENGDDDDFVNPVVPPASKYVNALQPENDYLITQSEENLITSSTPSLRAANQKADYSIRVLDLTQKNAPATTLKTLPRTLNLTQQSLRIFNENLQKHKPKISHSIGQDIEKIKTASSDRINVYSDKKRNLQITKPHLQSTTNECVSNLVGGHSKSCENFK